MGHNKIMTEPGQGQHRAETRSGQNKERVRTVLSLRVGALGRILGVIGLILNVVELIFGVFVRI
jgi:hypothetical protein